MYFVVHRLLFLISDYSFSFFRSGSYKSQRTTVKSALSLAKKPVNKSGRLLSSPLHPDVRRMPSVGLSAGVLLYTC